jgi:hypothetical protein
VVGTGTSVIEIIRLQQCLRLRYVTSYYRGEKGQNAYPPLAWRDHKAVQPEWVETMRKDFESRLDGNEARRTRGGMTTGNGFVGYIEPRSYANSDVNREWEWFIRGAIAHLLAWATCKVSD